MEYVHVDSIHADCTICQRRACGQTSGMSEQRERQVNSRPTGSSDSPRGHMRTIPLPGRRLAVGGWRLPVSCSLLSVPCCPPGRGMAARPPVPCILLPAPCPLPPDLPCILDSASDNHDLFTLRITVMLPRSSEPICSHPNDDRWETSSRFASALLKGASRLLAISSASTSAIQCPFGISPPNGCQSKEMRQYSYTTWVAGSAVPVFTGCPHFEQKLAS